MKAKPKEEAIFTAYQGNKISWKLTAYFKDEKYKLIFQKFNRIQPSKEQRLNGVKKKRVLIDQKTYFFSNLTNVDASKLPNPELATEFINKFKSIQKMSFIPVIG